MAEPDANDLVYIRCSESLLTCPICMERFVSPRILPCQHTFCKACISSLIERHCLDDQGHIKGHSVPCPTCRRDCKVRGKGGLAMKELLTSFPENLLLKSLLESEVQAHYKTHKLNSLSTKTGLKTKLSRDQSVQVGLHDNHSIPDHEIETLLLRYALFLDVMLNYFTEWSYNTNIGGIDNNKFFRNSGVNYQLAVQCRRIMKTIKSGMVICRDSCNTPELVEDIIVKEGHVGLTYLFGNLDDSPLCFNCEPAFPTISATKTVEIGIQTETRLYQRDILVFICSLLIAVVFYFVANVYF